MKHSIPFVIAIILLGCSDPSENAFNNLKKGNDFYSKKEYEIAEYYYEQIPEDSPVYKTARKRLNEIEKIKKLWGQPQATKKEVQEIVLVSHTFSIDNFSHFPSHQFTLVNNTDRKLVMVNVEFVYFDKSGTEIKRLTCPVITSLEGKKEKQFSGIRPGLLNAEIGDASAHVSDAQFE